MKVLNLIQYCVLYVHNCTHVSVLLCEAMNLKHENTKLENWLVKTSSLFSSWWFYRGGKNQSIFLLLWYSAAQGFTIATSALPHKALIRMHVLPWLPQWIFYFCYIDWCLWCQMARNMREMGAPYMTFCLFPDSKYRWQFRNTFV